ncbi:hypothetical protein PMIN07_012533 [Paraphaeosphaeria minitans]
MTSELVRRSVYVKPNEREEKWIQDAEDELQAEMNYKYNEALAEWQERGAPLSQKPKKGLANKAHGYITALAMASVALVVQAFNKRKKQDNKTGEFTKDHALLQYLEFPRNTTTQSYLVTRLQMSTLCAKWLTLKGILDPIQETLREDKRTRQKVVIGTAWPNYARILIAMLCHTYGDGNVLDYTASTKAEDRETNLRKFTDANEINKAWIMVFFSRVYRRGQTELKCYAITLINNASHIEKRKAKRMQMAADLRDMMEEGVDLQDRTYDVDEEI